MDKNRINNPILKLSQEHELFLGYFANIDKLMLENNLSALTLILRRLISYMKKDLYHHFEMEEVIFFRSVVDVAPNSVWTNMIEELRQEHQQLIKMLDVVSHRVKANPANTRETPRKVAAAVGPLISLIKQHIRKEVEELFPYIYENSQCVARIKQLIAMLNYARVKTAR